MMTLRILSEGIETTPVPTVWLIGDLGEARGKQELFTRQSPQKLKALRENALIQSAISSNRIEGVTVEQSRIGTVIFGNQTLRDRDEEEVRGYRDALTLVHEDGYEMTVSERNVLKLHELSQARRADAGKYKEKESDIIEKYPDGRERVRFRTMAAARTPESMREMIGLWNSYLVSLGHPMGCNEYRPGMLERWSEVSQTRKAHPLIVMASMNLDFLCIHPFRDGNGRTSRLLLLLQCYHLGYEVGRYISLERLIEENKGRYYETLEQSSKGWHEGKHDPWPYVNYILFILKSAYREFEERVGQMNSPRGTKREMIINAIDRRNRPFQVADLQRDCPGVSLDFIRKILKDLHPEVECLGRGRNAQWRKTDKWELGTN